MNRSPELDTLKEAAEPATRQEQHAKVSHDSRRLYECAKANAVTHKDRECVSLHALWFNTNTGQRITLIHALERSGSSWCEYEQAAAKLFRTQSSSGECC